MKAIALVDRHWGIGFEGRQPLFIREDLRRFSRLTKGGTLIVGYNTLLTFPDQLPLPGRNTLVLSRIKRDIRGATVYNRMEDLLAAAPEDSWVVGGASIFQQLVPRCSEAFITYADVECEVDRLFPNLEYSTFWRLEFAGGWNVENDIKFQYRLYSNTLAKTL